MLQRGYSNAAMVPTIRLCVCMNMIETKPFCASSSNLVDMLTMAKGWPLLILKVKVQGHNRQKVM